jgi:SAM-dependent methyltransferase
MENAQAMKCKICNNSEGNVIYEVKEMQFGLREKFSYFQCPECGCLQIAEVPSEISKYYPSTYYSFLSSSPEKPQYPIIRPVKTLRNRYAVSGKGIAGRLIYKLFPAGKLRMLSRIGLTEDSTVLDVGCGSGTILYDLKELGFNHLLGVDPYIKEDIAYRNGLNILKRNIHEVDGKWDLIMFHHSFEHIPDPIETMKSVSRLLKEGGVCLIRIPTVSSYAWEHYRENWVQLDAPRHFFLHSVKSIALLAGMTELTLEKVVYDSTEFQFWGSEQYKRDIPLYNPEKQSFGRSLSLFSRKEMEAFRRQAADLNLKNLGDSCAFYLRKKQAAANTGP